MGTTKLLKCQFLHTTVNHRKKFYAPLDAVMCPLQIFYDSESLSLTLHDVNPHFLHHLSNVKNYSICHKLKNDQPEPPPKNSYSGQHIFTPFCQL